MFARITLFVAAAIATLAVGAVSPAAAANVFEKNFWLSGPRYDSVVPLCDDPAVVGKIASRFAEKEHAYWQSKLRLVHVDRVREIAYRPWASDTIPRRWCAGSAWVSDGVKRALYYQIGEDTGMIGASWGVEWCIDGLDRNWAFNPHCKMARP